MTTPLTTSHVHVLLGELSVHFSVEAKVRGYHRRTGLCIAMKRSIFGDQCLSRSWYNYGPLDCARDDVLCAMCSYSFTQLQDWWWSKRVPCGVAVLVQVGSSDAAT